MEPASAKHFFFNSNTIIYYFKNIIKYIFFVYEIHIVLQTQVVKCIKGRANRSQICLEKMAYAAEDALI